MRTKSIAAKSPEELDAELHNIINHDFKPTLAFVFLTNMGEADAVVKMLDERGIAIFGATSSAVFADQHPENESIVILLLDLSTDYFTIVLKDHTKSSEYEAATHIGAVGTKSYRNPAFVISAAHIETRGEDIIKGLVDQAGVDATIIGGMAGEPLAFEGLVFTNGSSSSKGTIALVIDQDKIEIKGLAVSCWKPVGTEKTITASDGSWILSIDDQPAMDVIKKYTGGEIEHAADTNGIIRLETAYPLQVSMEEGSPVMRPTLLFNTNNKSVMVGGLISEGSKFRFSLPPDFEVIDAVVESSREMKADELPEADAMIVFSCIGRLESLGPMASKELEGLAETWKAPMVGFYSLGEFGKTAGGKPEFHGTTCSWIALKEK